MMTNGERIMRDVALIVREYEIGGVKDINAILKINELTDQSCEHCIYLGSCQKDTRGTCYNGFLEYIARGV